MHLTMIAAGALAFALFPNLANSELPPGAEPGPLSQWFQSLRHPLSGHSCCSIADCRAVRVRMAGGHYEVLDGSVWLVVPDNSILQQRDNPVGEPVACIRVGVVLCFVRGPET